MRLGITGAGGQMGGALLRYTLGRTAAPNVVAITRNPAKLEPFSQQGVEVRPGDFSQPAGLAAAFRGIDRLLIIPTSDLQPGVRTRQQADAITAAVAAGVPHLIYVSTVSPRPDPDNSLFDSHFATEQALISSGAAWTLLRMSVYTDTLADAGRRAAESGSYAAVPGAPAAYVVREDVASAAAGILCTPGHAGITYHATGPASVTQEEIADAIASASGKPVKFVKLTEDQQRAGLEAAGIPPAYVKAILGFQAALRAGAFDLVTGDVARLGGKTAESVSGFLGRTLGRKAHA